MLRALKVIGLGTLIWLFTFLTIIVWTLGYAIYKTMGVDSHGGNVDIRTGLGGHAIGLSAIVFNPIPYLIILAAYGVAYWIVIARKRKGLTAAS
jgi:hypothetical protein